MTAAAIAAPPGPAYTITDGVVVLNAGPPPGIRSRAHFGGVPCVHLDTAEPPRLLLLGWDAVARLNFQTRYVETPDPAHASRRGDQLVLAFDTVSGRCCPTRGKNEARPVTHRWTYQLHRFRWASSPELCSNIVAAVRGDR